MPPRIVSHNGKSYSFPENAQNDEILNYLYENDPAGFKEPDPEEFKMYRDSAKARQAKIVEPRGKISTTANIPETFVTEGLRHGLGAQGGLLKQVGESFATPITKTQSKAETTAEYGRRQELGKKYGGERYVGETEAQLGRSADGMVPPRDPGYSAKAVEKEIFELADRHEKEMEAVNKSWGKDVKDVLTPAGEKLMDASRHPEDYGLSWLGTPMGTRVESFKDINTPGKFFSNLPELGQTVASGAATFIPIMAASMVPGGGLLASESLLYSEQYNESIEAGYSKEEAHTHATNYAIGAATLEYLGALGATRPLRRWFGRDAMRALKGGKKVVPPTGVGRYLDKALKVITNKRLGDVGRGTFFEGLTEFAQAAWSDVVTGGLKPKSFEDWLFEGFIGGLAGGATSAMGPPAERLGKALQERGDAKKTFDAIKKADPGLAEHIRKKGLWGIIQKVRSGEIATAEDFVEAVGYTLEPLSKDGEHITDLIAPDEEGRRQEFAKLEERFSKVFEENYDKTATGNHYNQLLLSTQKLPTFYSHLKNALLYGKFEGFSEKESSALRLLASESDIVDHLYEMEHRAERALPGDQRVVLESAMLENEATPTDQVPSIIKMYEDVLWNISTMFKDPKTGDPLYKSVAEFVNSPDGAPLLKAITEQEAEAVATKAGYAVGTIPSGFWGGMANNIIAMTLSYANTSTPFHEITHFWLERMKRLVSDNSAVGQNLISLINEVSKQGVSKIKSLQQAGRPHSEALAQLSEIFMLGRSPEGLSPEAADGLMVLREGMRGIHEYDKQRRVKMDALRKALDPEMATGLGAESLEGLRGIFDFMFFGANSATFAASLTNVQNAFTSLHQMNPLPLLSSPDIDLSVDAYVALQPPKGTEKGSLEKLVALIDKLKPMISFVDHSLWDLYDLEMMLLRDIPDHVDAKTAKGMRTKALNNLSKRLKELDPDGTILKALPYEGAKNTRTRDKLKAQMEERLRLLQEKLRVLTFDGVLRALQAVPEGHVGPVEVVIGKMDETGLLFQFRPTKVPTIINKSPDDHFREMPPRLQQYVRRFLDLKKQLTGVLNANEPPTDVLAEAATIMQEANVRFVDPTPLFDAQKLMQLPNEQIMYRFYYANKQEWTEVPEFQVHMRMNKETGAMQVLVPGFTGPRGEGLFDTFAVQQMRKKIYDDPEFQLTPEQLRSVFPKTAVVDNYGGKTVGAWGASRLVGSSQTFYPEETPDNRGRWEPRGDVQNGKVIEVYHTSATWQEGHYDISKVNSGIGAGGDNIGAFFTEGQEESAKYATMVHKTEITGDFSPPQLGELEQEIRDRIEFGKLSEFDTTSIRNSTPGAPNMVWTKRSGPSKGPFYIDMSQSEAEELVALSEQGEVYVALLPTGYGPSSYRTVMISDSDNALMENLENFFYFLYQEGDAQTELVGRAKGPFAYDKLLDATAKYEPGELELIEQDTGSLSVPDENGSINLGKKYINKVNFTAAEVMSDQMLPMGADRLRVTTPSFVTHFKEPVTIGNTVFHGIAGTVHTTQPDAMLVAIVENLRAVGLSFGQIVEASGLPPLTRQSPTNTHQLYLDLQKPFDLNLGVKGSMGQENVSEAEAKARIRQAIMDNGGVFGPYVSSDPTTHSLEAVIESIYDPTTKYPYHTSDKHLRGILNNTVDGRAVMKALGFDSATHMGRNQVRKWIAFDSKQIYHKFLVHKGIDEHGEGRFDEFEFQMAKKRPKKDRLVGTSLQKETLVKYGIIRDDYSPEGDPREHLEQAALLEAANAEMKKLERSVPYRNEIAAKVAKGMFSEPAERLAFIMFHLKRWGRLSQMATQGSQYAARQLKDIEANIKPVLSEMGTQAGRDLYVHKLAHQFAELPFVINELLQVAKRLGFDARPLVELSNFADLNAIKGIKAGNLKEFEAKLRELERAGKTDLSDPQTLRERMVLRAVETLTAERSKGEVDPVEVNKAIDQALFMFNKNEIVTDLVTTIAYNNMLMTMGRIGDAITSAGMLIWKTSFEPLGEATWELMRTLPKGFAGRKRLFSEIGTAPAMQSLKLAVKTSVDIMSGEISWLDFQRRWEVNLGRTSAIAHIMSMHGTNKAMRGAGLALDFLPRFMTAMDAFFRISAESMVHKQYLKRRAQWESEGILEEMHRDLSVEVNKKRRRDKRLSPEELEKKLAEPGGALEFIETYTSMMGAQTTFQVERGAIAETAMQARDKLDQAWLKSPAGRVLPVPIVRLFAMPFVPTIANIAKFSMEFTPVSIGLGTGSGTLLALGGLGPAASVMSKTNLREFFAKQFAAHILMLIFGNMLDDEWIAGPEENSTEREFNAQRGKTPYSFAVKVPWEAEPIYVPIPAPLSFSLIPIAARMKAIKSLSNLDPDSKEAEELRGEIRRSIVRDVIDNTFINNMMGIVNDTYNANLQRPTARFIENLVPSSGLLKQVNQIWAKVKYGYVPWTKKTDQSVGEIIYTDLAAAWWNGYDTYPWNDEHIPTVVDYFGRKVGSRTLLRLPLPSSMVPERPGDYFSPAEMEFARLGFYPAGPGPSIEGVPLTKEQHSSYYLHFGIVGMKMLERLVESPAYRSLDSLSDGKEKQIFLLDKYLSQARTIAARETVLRNPELRQQVIRRKVSPPWQRK